MIISDIVQIGSSDHARFGWSGLRAFQNVHDVTRQIMIHHGLGERDRANARRQAEQIRYCLQQAQEYSLAAAAVSLSTKPLLQYYSIMSLALAEILFKQDANSNLERAREVHRHHGLGLAISQKGNWEDPISSSGNFLRAKPNINSGGDAIGTFALWHRSARPFPLGGNLTSIRSNQSTSGFEAIFGIKDEPMPSIPKDGVSLLHCFGQMPGMTDFLRLNGLDTELVRGRISVNANIDNRTYATNVVVHPHSNVGVMADMMNSVKIKASDIGLVKIQEYQSGFAMDWTVTEESTVRLELPNGVQMSEDTIHFSPRSEFLNEFGNMYCASYMLGMYARYYPERWMRDVENGSQLALAAHQFMECLEVRAPILTLSEFKRLGFVSA